MKKIPIISLAHGNELLSKSKYKISRIKKTLNNVTSITANSFFTKKLVTKLLFNNIPVKVVYPGAIDLRNLKEIEVGKIEGSPVLLTLARLEKRKGHKNIIESIKKILPKFQNLQYIIAGDGPEKNFLKNLVKQHNLQKNIKFIGSVDDQQKKYLFLKTDLMVMPTLDETINQSIEGFGISYLEAAFFGIPSIASDVGGTSEAVLHNKTGIIIDNFTDLTNVLNDLLLNRKFLKNLGEQAKIRAENEFNWSKVAKKYLF